MNKKLYTMALGMLCLFFTSQKAFANNLVISDVSLTNDSTLTFKVSWDNSWRTNSAPYNHDAVWLFIKKRDCASLKWSHVDVSPTSSHHSTSSPLEIYIDGRDAGINAKGIFVRRSAVGSGNISATTVSIRMRGIPAGQFDFKVFGIEMVQIPAGAFYLGDGSGSYGTFRAGNTNNPFYVGSEGAITSGTGAASLYAITSSLYYPVSLPAPFPKGYKEIYCMKYELSQGQYIDFVNTLTTDQATARAVPASPANRLTITGSWPAFVASTPHIAMVGINWYDLLSYLDWSALRPMTELEYEKVCRGPEYPVVNEFAWGTNIVTDANALVAGGTPTENSSSAITIGGGIANYGNNSILGPLRCGFAAKPGTNRLTAGATYYGVMEMSGNAAEMVVSTVDGTGAGFTGVLGDGEVSLSPVPGNANVANWPSAGAGTAGACLRGGSWGQGEGLMRTSERTQSNTFPSVRTNFFYGGRGVR